MFSQDTFSFPFNELQVDKPKPGDWGEICIKVEVVSVDKEGITVRKHGPAVVSEPFSEISLDQLKEKIGTTDEHETPFKKAEDVKKGEAE